MQHERLLGYGKALPIHHTSKRRAVSEVQQMHPSHLKAGQVLPGLQRKSAKTYMGC